MSQPAFEQFRQAFLAGDADRLADAFMPEGAYAVNTGMLLTGRDQIRAGAAEWFRRRPPGAVVDVELNLIRLHESGQFRWELIEYRQHGFVPDQPEAGALEETGYALAVYRRDDTRAWRIESLVVNLRRAV
jgi:uncharacterized protein (TIGR02246 family)